MIGLQSIMTALVYEPMMNSVHVHWPCDGVIGGYGCVKETAYILSLVFYII